MSDHQHQPVSLVGLLVLAALVVIFLVVIWLIGAAFAQAEPVFTLNKGNRVSLTAFF